MALILKQRNLNRSTDFSLQPRQQKNSICIENRKRIDSFQMLSENRMDCKQEKFSSFRAHESNWRQTVARRTNGISLFVCMCAFLVIELISFCFLMEMIVFNNKFYLFSQYFTQNCSISFTSLHIGICDSSNHIQIFHIAAEGSSFPNIW